MLAEVDDRLLRADVARERATLATRQADVKRVEAELQQATNNEKRRVIIAGGEQEIFV